MDLKQYLLNFFSRRKLEKSRVTSKFEVKEEFGTLSFNNVLLYREDTKMYQVIF